MISVIIPVYNRQELVKETLDSVLAQTYSDWECIVVDDGSTDNTWEVLQEYAQKDARIKPFQRNREPKGAPTCRNMGIDLSKGEYLMFLDSDDLLAPWALESRRNIFQNGDFDVVLSNGVNFDFTQKCILDYRASYNENDILTNFTNLRFPFQTSTPTWKRSFLKVNEIYWDEKYSKLQDIEFHIHCFYHNPNFAWGEKLPNYFMRKEGDIVRISSLKGHYVIDNYYLLLSYLNKFGFLNDEILKVWRFEIIKKIETFSKFEIKKVLTNKETNFWLTKKENFYLKLYYLTLNIKGIHGIAYRLRRLFIGKEIKIFPINALIVEDEIKKEVMKEWPSLYEVRK